MPYNIKVLEIETKDVTDADGPTIRVKKDGSISAAGRVESDDNDVNQLALALLVFSGDEISSADEIPPYEDYAEQATVVYTRQSGRWECSPITGTIPAADLGASNQLVIWGLNPNSTTVGFKDFQNFTAIEIPPEEAALSDERAAAGLIFEMRGSISKPSGTAQDDPYPVTNTEGVGSIQASGAILGPINSPLWVAVFRGVPYPMVLPQTPTANAVTVQSGVGGSWSAIVGNVACSSMTPFPVNQLVVWNWVPSTSAYSVGSVIFHGRRA